MNFATTADLDAALPNIMASPISATIDILCHRPDFSHRTFPDQISLTVAGGIADERWLKHPWATLPNGSPDPRIQVSILNKRLLDVVWRDRENTLHPGDTIIADMELSEGNLPVGRQIAVGTAVIEVSDLFNEACVKWKARYGVDSYNWLNRLDLRPLRPRGVLCRIVQDGIVRKGDQIQPL